jgi:hypothetical protein
MLRARTSISLLALATLVSACDKKDEKTTTTSASQPATSATTAKVEATAATAAADAAATAATSDAGAGAMMGAKKKEPVVSWKGVGLATPESVFYDDAADMYLVSNINGQPLDVDNNGFISRLTPDGKVETLKWIEGGKNKVTLNAPKGLAVVGDVLYVADIDAVRLFDKKTGAPQGEVKVPGATFLNDLATTPDGKVLVSDSGLKAGAKGFDPTGTDAVYAIDKAKKLTTISKSKDLGAPNGLYATADKTWVVTFGSGELYSLDAKGKKGDVQKLPKGALDGILPIAGGDVLISSWESNSVYRGKPGGDFAAVVTDVKSPADIGYDTKRGRVLVPLFMESEVHAFEIK